MDLAVISSDEMNKKITAIGRDTEEVVVIETGDGLQYRRDVL